MSSAPAYEGTGFEHRAARKKRLFELLSCW